MRIKYMPAFAFVVVAIAQPVYAFGPAGMGRDLMYTASIAPAPPHAAVVKAGFVRPNVPSALAEVGRPWAHGSSFSEFSRPLSVAVNFVFQNMLAKTVGAIDASVELSAAR